MTDPVALIQLNAAHDAALAVLDGCRSVLGGAEHESPGRRCRSADAFRLLCEAFRDGGRVP